MPILGSSLGGQVPGERIREGRSRGSSTLAWEVNCLERESERGVVEDPRLGGQLLGERIREGRSRGSSTLAWEIKTVAEGHLLPYECSTPATSPKPQLQVQSPNHKSKAPTTSRKPRLKNKATRRRLIQKKRGRRPPSSIRVLSPTHKSKAPATKKHNKKSH